MPDLGEHADTVLLAYSVAALLLLGFGFTTWRAARNTRRALKAAEDLIQSKR
ncbi:MAG: heme exporter protein CcmD [Pseudomonadota bacterium]